MLSLDITARKPEDTVVALRKRGCVPAVFYGPKEASCAVSIDAKQFTSLWKQAGESTVITLKGVESAKDTLIHDVQFHPVTGAIIHADFYVLEKGKKVEVTIPLEFAQVAPAEKLGLIVVKALHEIEIEVDPKEIPHHLIIDLSKLQNIGDHIVASDIVLPASATLITHAGEIIASVTEPEKEVVASVAPAAATPAPEKKTDSK